MDEEKRMEEARLLASQRAPYLSRGLFSIRLVAAESVATYALTSGWTLYYNPEYTKSVRGLLPLAGIILHQLIHLIGDHHGRQKLHPLHPRVFSFAACLATNSVLKGDNLCLPPNALLPENFGLPEGRSAEDYYKLLLERSHGDNGPSGKSPEESWGSDPNDFIPGTFQADLTDRSTADQVEPFIGDMILDDLDNDQAQFGGDTQGYGGGNIARTARERRPSKIDWRVQVRGFVGSAIGLMPGPERPTFSRMSRRQSAVPHVRLSGHRKPRLRIAIVIDTSASMSIRQIDQGVGEIGGILKLHSLETEILLFVVDAQVQSVQAIANIKNLELKGGGGTDMSLGVRTATDLTPRVDAVIVLTDGVTNWPAERPSPTPVLAILFGKNGKTPPSWIRSLRIEEVQ